MIIFMILLIILLLPDDKSTKVIAIDINQGGKVANTINYAKNRIFRDIFFKYLKIRIELIMIINIGLK